MEEEKKITKPIVDLLDQFEEKKQEAPKETIDDFFNAPHPITQSPPKEQGGDAFDEFISVPAPAPQCIIT